MTSNHARASLASAVRSCFHCFSVNTSHIVSFALAESAGYGDLNG